MRKIKFLMIIFLVSCITWIACDPDVLETVPLDRISADATWSDASLSEAFIFGVYSSLGYGGFEEQGLAVYTDEAMFTHAGRNIERWTQGGESASAIAWVSSTYEWSAMYNAIRSANVALFELPTSTFADDDKRDRLMGESHFLRAYYYQQLLRYYGGVPLIAEPLKLDSDFEVARNTYEENVNFIVADLDNAIDLLEGKEETPGRASMVSAMALKARVLLYAASDIHDGPTASSVGAIGGFSNLDLVAYTSGGQQARWLAAQTAAKDVMDATEGYKFGLSAPVSQEEGRDNYVAIAMGGGSATSDEGAAVELLFQRTSTAAFSAVEDAWPLGPIHYGVNNGPNGYHNWAGNTPIQQLVDDYELMDGSAFDWNNPVHAADPYATRDPRFYATILYDGAGWKPRPDDVADKDPVSQIQTGSYDDGEGGDRIPGLDTRESPVENWNGSRTHYYIRKFIDPDPAIIDITSAAQEVPWPFIRYTEMVLNYVEASLELGDEGEARNWLNQIRFRAGMPATNASGTGLVDLYRNERRIELVYEEHRFHDVRRWMIPEETVGRGIKVIDIEANLKPGQSPTTPYMHDKSVYDYKYSVVNNTDIEVRTWVDAMYYRSLSRDELNKNSALINNPGY